MLGVSALAGRSVIISQVLKGLLALRVMMKFEEIIRTTFCQVVLVMMLFGD